ncbi:MAG: ester cyclase [Actinomycetota bacterium]
MTSEQHRAVLTPLRAALYDATPDGVRAALSDTFAADVAVHLSFPFEDLDGPSGLFEHALGPLQVALPDLERRDWIVMAGPDANGKDWVGCGGTYTGTFLAPFLDIPPTGLPVSMRFHEFYRVEGDRVVEMQALWDIPELLMQAGVWPMGPSLGREWRVPGPATGDGVRTGPRDDAWSTRCHDHVVGMLTDMGRHPTEPVEVMRLDHWWHPRFSWYGPAGIGTSRGIPGFRHHHQIPFLNAMPDRTGGGESESHFFADGPYVGVTAWPGMAMTLTGDGWLGIAPAGRAITMRSLDFWRVERTADGSLKIRENWVLVDLLSVWDQLGVDVLGRMRELTTPRARVAGETLAP